MAKLIMAKAIAQEPKRLSPLKTKQRKNIWVTWIRSSGAIALAGCLTWGSFPTLVLAQSPVAPVPTSLPVDEGYTLGAGDRLKVDIFNVPEYSGEFLILSDGSLNLPVVGAVQVQGLTFPQASDKIATVMSRYLRNPIVTLSLISVRPVKVGIAGEVYSPGVYSMSLNGNEEVALPTVTRVIDLAGGITQAADIRRIQIRRSRSSQQDSDQIITVDLWRLLQTADLSQDLLLRDGDSLFIPTATDVDLQESSILANASFAGADSGPLKIAVVGEVNRPGPYTINNNSEENDVTVTAAIQSAGGITEQADIRNIQVRRLTKSGKEQIVDVDLWKLLQEGDLRQDMPLQEGDTIVIGTATELSPDEATELASTSFSPAVINVNIVGEVIRPGRVEVLPNTPLAQALLAAGGFNNNARERSVELIRLNPNGTVTKREVSIDFSRALDEGNNPALRNNDTIVVSPSRVAELGNAVSPVFNVLGTVGGIFTIPRTVYRLFDDLF
ncbi:SLBB domain-containing protein [Roseofilum reptotaenium CS-1145]|uniref:SLBB domain-containing protein n=1 Tax=Roseofilum reptotaenium TaxID=1233427 RepID=UPI00232E1110|nr:SLBB domain-containing protein [Roseofilum reptotaenium]MDB9518201.1 SLBB domain-containing protein [Roseofilum reptotaenium CS-1145]